MQRSLWLRRAAAVTVLALAAAACGGNGNESTTSSESPSTAESSAPATSSESMSPSESGSQAAAPQNESNGVLELGYVMPETGPLAFLGPPQIEATKMAVDEINAAGGVLDKDVTLSGADEAGDATVAAQSAQRLLNQGVDAIVGAAASGMSLAIIDAVTGAGVLQCSASNTSPTFTNYDDHGLYFRTAPTDALQGPVLAETIAGDGYSQVALMARADDYGRGLLESTKKALENQGATVVADIVYDPEAASFDSEVQQVVNSGADAVAIIGFDEGAKILKGLVEAGKGPQDIGVYGADGMRSETLAEKVDPNNPGVLEGMKGTAPAGTANKDFLTKFKEKTGVEDTQFAAQAYDCTNLIALAAVAANSDKGTDIASKMIDVSKDGEQCTDFASCKKLLDEGKDIDYQGASGSVDMVEAGEPASGTYEVWKVNAQGKIDTVKTVESHL